MKSLESPCCEAPVKVKKYKKTWHVSGAIVTYYICSKCNTLCTPIGGKNEYLSKM